MAPGSEGACGTVAGTRADGGVGEKAGQARGQGRSGKDRDPKGVEGKAGDVRLCLLLHVTQERPRPAGSPDPVLIPSEPLRV